MQTTSFQRPRRQNWLMRLLGCNQPAPRAPEPAIGCPDSLPVRKHPSRDYPLTFDLHDRFASLSNPLRDTLEAR